VEGENLPPPLSETSPSPTMRTERFSSLLLPQEREDLETLIALTRCARRRNSQVAIVLAVVLISLASCFVPRVSKSQQLGSDLPASVFNEDILRRFVPERIGDSSPSWHRNIRTRAPLQGGGLAGRSTSFSESLRRDSSGDRSGRILSYRGGASNGEIGANASNARGVSGRGKASPFVPRFLRDQASNVNTERSYEERSYRVHRVRRSGINDYLLGLDGNEVTVLFEGVGIDMKPEEPNPSHGNRTGTWLCAKSRCKKVNYRHRYTCYNCGATKPPNFSVQMMDESPSRVLFQLLNFGKSMVRVFNAPPDGFRTGGSIPIEKTAYTVYHSCRVILTDPVMRDKPINFLFDCSDFADEMESPRMSPGSYLNKARDILTRLSKKPSFHCLTPLAPGRTKTARGETDSQAVRPTNPELKSKSNPQREGKVHDQSSRMRLPAPSLNPKHPSMMSENQGRGKSSTGKRVQRRAQLRGLGSPDDASLSNAASKSLHVYKEVRAAQGLVEKLFLDGAFKS